MRKKSNPAGGYTDAHARAGLRRRMPRLDVWENQFSTYEIVISTPEFTSICPKTGLPDFGTVTIRYMPAKKCVELKALKLYLNAYRNIGIFQENAVNRILDDFVAAVRPKWAVVAGVFNARGGIGTTVDARFPRAMRGK